MHLDSEAALLAHMARWWLLERNAYKPNRRPPRVTNPKFVTPRQAVADIPDGAVVLGAGMAGHSPATTLYRAMRDRYRRTGHPRSLTWVAVGALGARGWLPGTLEELDAPGLITELIIGHLETLKALLTRAEAGHIEVHTMPQGEMALLIENQGRGRLTRQSTVGVGTFLDPRVGPGSGVTPDAGPGYITARGTKLGYRLPELEVAVLSAPFADELGNLYLDGASAVTEVHDGIRAVHRNGGQVVVMVGGLVDHDPARVAVPGEWVDRIVVDPKAPHMFAFPYLDPWTAFLPGRTHDRTRVLRTLHNANLLLGVTPRRSPADEALGRLAASVFVQQCRPGGLVNIGVGLPEEVARIVAEAGMADDVVFSSETGVYGGVPASGSWFGGCVDPRRIESSSWMFHQYQQRLDTTVLGFLEVDSAGNVNASWRSSGVADYVGPGGFPNLVAWARNIVFVGKWQQGGGISVNGHRLRIRRGGTPKFVDRVREVTFNAGAALEAGTTVHYVTNVGVFRLTGEGLQLVQVMPGLDIERDIVAASGARIVVPPGDVPVIDRSIVTGRGFALTWP